VNRFYSILRNSLQNKGAKKVNFCYGIEAKITTDYKSSWNQRGEDSKSKGNGDVLQSAVGLKGMGI
jgi:hypothetical protein